ncbi:MAG TPA: ACP phosphodiesterase [Bacteroidia bacterium]|nr:ACP phosphodiesterase [Bacteroidia bacterium]
MNFLAHLYLSGDNKQLRIGNFIGDHVKGKAINNLPPEIIEGVLLHRKIDFFTDNHPVVSNSKIQLRTVFNKYAGVVSDVYFDHFLATKWEQYSDISLAEFADAFYQETAAFAEFLPERTQQMLPYMIKNNWLVSYASIEGIGSVLKGMSRRTNFKSNMEFGAEELLKNYTFYENDFNEFFPDLIDFVQTEMKGK